MHSSEETAIQTRRRRVKFRVLTLVLGLAVGMGVMEGGARIAWRKKYVDHLELQLHGYDQVDVERGIIVPTPGTRKTVGEMRQELVDHHKPLGLAHLEALVDRFELESEDLVFEVNDRGFKGPSFAVPKENGTFRVLAVGDSCTWGPYYDRLSYPRVLEEELRRIGEGREEVPRVEVVNAGVNGYNFESVLRRIDDYLGADPDLVLVYLGWNRTIGRADPKRNPRLYRWSAVYRIYYHLLQNQTGTAFAGYDVDGTYLDPDEPLLGELRDHDFRQDLEDLDTLVESFRDQNPECRVVVATLPGLFDERIEPDSAAIEKAYPITFTKNLSAWAVLTRKYNEALRAHCRERSLPIVDLETFALKSFLPRSDHFEDSVHPTSSGYEKIGKYLALEIVEFLDW